MSKDINTAPLPEEKRFKAWLYWLTRAGFHKKLWKEDVVLCPRSWKYYFDEGLSVWDALKEDLKYV